MLRLADRSICAIAALGRPSTMAVLVDVGRESDCLFLPNIPYYSVQ